MTSKPGSSDMGPDVAFIGIRGRFLPKWKSFQLHIPFPQEQRGFWADFPSNYRPMGSVTRQAMGKLAGRLSSSQTLRSGKFPRAKLLPFTRI